jgi:hypothetical protein
VVAAEWTKCWFEDRDLKVHLSVDHEFRAARKAHPALLVSELPALVEVLRNAGIDIRHSRRLQPCIR